MSARAEAGELQQNVFESAEDAVRWALLRRQAYALDADRFFSVTAIAWAERTLKIVAGEPFDESRMLRLRSGASVPYGVYSTLTGKEPADGDEEGDEASSDPNGVAVNPPSERS